MEGKARAAPATSPVPAPELRDWWQTRVRSRDRRSRSCTSRAISLSKCSMPSAPPALMASIKLWFSRPPFSTHAPVREDFKGCDPSARIGLADEALAEDRAERLCENHFQRPKRRPFGTALSIRCKFMFRPSIYFFDVAFFLPKLVSTGAPILASRSFALWALGPVGANSRYFWRDSTVPGAGIVLSP